jgi:hypothetical protein
LPESGPERVQEAFRASGALSSREDRKEREMSRRHLGVVAALATTFVIGACTARSEPRNADPEAIPPIPTFEETARGYSVDIDPQGFVDTIDNPYMPLTPGSSWRLEGKTAEGREVDTITVLDATREVMGVTTTVVRDVVKLEGSVVEKTWDWFAQDLRGNVWYFGEDTAEYENGKIVSRAGAWEAGVDGALPGIVMPADPLVNDASRQEFYRGEAEDMGWVVQTGISVEVPAGSYDDAIRVLEWSPVEPKVVGQKLYAPGVGIVSEKALAGGLERFELVDVTTP